MEKLFSKTCCLIMLLTSFSITYSYAYDNNTLGLVSRFHIKKQKYLKQALDNKNIIGLEYLETDKTGVGLASMGHAALHFVDDDNDPLNDLVISFEMVVIEKNDTGLSSLVFPKRQLSLVPYTLLEYLNSYLVNSITQIHRHIIPTDQNTRNKMLTQIYQISLSPSILGSYNLVFNNCMSGVLKLLSGVGVHVLNNKSLNVPRFSEGVLRKHFLLTYPTMTIKGLYPYKELINFIKKQNKILSSPYEMMAYPHEVALRDLNKYILNFGLDAEGLAVVERLWIKSYGPKPEVFNDLREELGDVSYYKVIDLYGYKKAPEELYQVCMVQEADCFKKRLNLAKKFYGKKNVLRSNNILSNFYRNEIERYKKLVGGINSISKFEDSILQNEVFEYFDLKLN